MARSRLRDTVYPLLRGLVLTLFQHPVVLQISPSNDAVTSKCNVGRPAICISCSNPPQVIVTDWVPPTNY